ncbi:hypothetical protein LTR62_005141 [Meristemomyces frigidus]|uniref:Uncharacterized protein n=1 Tax=Meristemomyces frigidus TaxID=1508187 RepID=A0AAN7YKG4_9PEZI|nr:hypothetical protein LTR62_005141 [Meristemomyces frigidus]
MADAVGQNAGWAYAKQANTGVMDREKMTSPQAEAARLRSAEVMEALRSGEPGAADHMMVKPPKYSEKATEGKEEKKGLGGWFKEKVGGKGKGEGDVVR